jgi:pimeloyl-ACP methyl ester carboxylesterase
MAPLRTYLRWLGHDAQPWGFGVNAGAVDASADRLAGRVAALAGSSGRTVDLIGWSLGGVVARETARRLGPDVVGQVVTFGSPIVGGPAFTAAAPRMTEAHRRRWVHRVEAVERDDPLRVPVTSIFTRRDAVVPWQASLDHHSVDVSHIEVSSTHLTLGVDPDVWEIIARRLGERS